MKTCCCGKSQFFEHLIKARVFICNRRHAIASTNRCLQIAFRQVKIVNFIPTTCFDGGIDVSTSLTLENFNNVYILWNGLFKANLTDVKISN